MARKSKSGNTSKDAAKQKQPEKKPSTATRKRHAPDEAKETGSILDENTKRDIVGVAFIILAIVFMLLAVLPTNDAIVSGVASNSLHLIFGVGAYMLPFFLAAIGITFLYRSQKQRMPVRAAIGLSIVFISLLGFIALFSPITVLGQPDLSLLFVNAILVTYGGYIGAGIAWCGIALFGHIVTGVLLIGAMIVGVVIIGFSVSKLVESIHKKQKELLERRRSTASDDMENMPRARMRRASQQAALPVNANPEELEESPHGETRPLVRLQSPERDERRRLGVQRMDQPLFHESISSHLADQVRSTSTMPLVSDHDSVIRPLRPEGDDSSRFNLVRLAEQQAYEEDARMGATHIGGFALPVIGKAAELQQNGILEEEDPLDERTIRFDRNVFESQPYVASQIIPLANGSSSDSSLEDAHDSDQGAVRPDVKPLPSLGDLKGERTPLIIEGMTFDDDALVSSEDKPKTHYVHLDADMLLIDPFEDAHGDADVLEPSSMDIDDDVVAEPVELHAVPISSPSRTRAKKPSKAKASTKRATPAYGEERDGFKLPSMALLASSDAKDMRKANEAELSATAERLQQTISDFGIKAQVVGWIAGPTVTLFKVDLPSGVRVSRITALNDDIALALAAPGVRIFAPIPGTNHVGIEVPNETRQTVLLKDVLQDAPDGPLQIAIGKDVEGNSIVSDLAKMPHLLIGGTTGSGKSVSINAMIMSILMRATPDEVRFIMIDPKRVEFTPYNGIPHLYVPVVTEPKEAASALSWGVAEMERRLKVFSGYGARNIQQYNAKVDDGLEDENGNELEKLPYIVIIIDELADLMMNVGKEVEFSISRIAQLARAAGIHLIVATQRPSTNVVTGLIKANITNRIAFNVASGIDSRVILDTPGAENLIGLGDLLLSKPEMPKPQRIQGCYVSEDEISAVVETIKGQLPEDYHSEILQTNVYSIGDTNPHGGSGGDDDPLIWEAAEIVVSSKMGSTSNIQRRLKVGYARAGRIMDQLEEKGIVGSPNGSKPREVLVDEMELETLKAFESQD